MTTNRFRDPGEVIGTLPGPVLAECPACGGCARVDRHDDRRNVCRAVCPSCAWSRDLDPERTVYGVPTDPWFGLPLWLRTPVGEHELWALGAAHLDLLEQFAGARLRERTAEQPFLMTMVEQLPAWLKSAKNRDAVLAGLARLRVRLAEA